MATKLEVINLALNLLGEEEQISDLSENTKNARVARLVYDPTFLAFLGEHSWNFAIKRVHLQTVALPAPIYEWERKFTLPADCIDVVRLGEQRDWWRPEYQIEGRDVLTNELTIYLTYKSSDVDIQNAHPLFIKALSAYLAIEFTNSLDGKRRKLNDMVTLADLWTSKAIKADNQNSAYTRDESPWIIARYIGSNYNLRNVRI
jgi:hypothetical protein